ncbi:MAG: hypothetical protein OK457_03760 [Thaumarchaeota archaeon]|nr:hypothetical protein [Nitrososphaerota archaeon]
MSIKYPERTPQDWSKEYLTYFWDSHSPLAVKYNMESITGILLERAEPKGRDLVYVGETGLTSCAIKLKLTYIAALPERNWYSLEVDCWVPRSWSTENEFLMKSNRAFTYWSGKLNSINDRTAIPSSIMNLYDQRVLETVEKEKQVPPSSEEILQTQEIQRMILEKLRKGKSFRTAHHEGGTIIFFDGTSFVQRIYGEEESTKNLESEKEALEYIKQLYDWDSRKDYYPHRPPELTVWKYIQRQLL